MLGEGGEGLARGVRGRNGAGAGLRRPAFPASPQLPVLDQAAQRCLAEKEKENKAPFAPHRSGGGTRDGWDPGSRREPVAGAAAKMRAVGAESQGTLLAKRMGGTARRVRDWQSGNRGSGKLWPAAVQDLSLTAGL